MQNMKRYFGFEVHIDNDLTPEGANTLRQVAVRMASDEGVDISEYHIYIHNLYINADEAHWGFTGGLAARIEKIKLEFYVNKKQRENRSIIFKNYRLGREVSDDVRHFFDQPQGVKPHYSPAWIGYEMKGDYFDQNNWFRNCIIAFVRRDIRKAHKKVKVVITAKPSPEFGKLLAEKIIDPTTQLDLRFEKELQLRFPFEDSYRYREEEMGMHKKGDINNSGTIGSIIINSGDHNRVITFSDDFNKNFDQDLKILLVEAQNERRVAEVRSLELALKASKEKSNLTALEYLKGAAGWGLKTAERLGLTAAEAAIKAAIGLS